MNVACPFGRVWLASRRRFGKSLSALGILALTAGSLAHAQVIYTYDNTTSLSIPDNGCPATVERTFSVAETFTVGGSGTIAVGVDITHTFRGDLILQLIAPNGAAAALAASNGGDGDDNYRVMFSSNADTGNALDDNDADPVVAGGIIRYRRLVTAAPLDTFFTGPANGTWRIRVCDDFGVDTGTLNSARLVLRDNAATAPQVCANTSTFDWGANGNATAFTSVSVAPDGVLLSQVSTSGEALTDAGSGVPSFVTRTSTQGNQAGYYSLNMDTSGDTELTAESVLFGFDAPVSGLSFSLLDIDKGGGATTWEDYVNVFATGPNGRVPYQVTLVNTSNTAFAGEWVETDIAAATTSTAGNIIYSFLEPVEQVRINYAQGNEPNTNSVFQIIGVGDFAFCTYDYADAPNSYGTLLASSGPGHGLRDRSRLFIGTTAPDGEGDGQVSAGATGDDSSAISDENGITFPASRLPNLGWVCGAHTTDPTQNQYCVSINVTNTTGSAAQLVAWIDFNNDGDFTDAGERSLPDLASAATSGFNTGNIANGTSGSSVVLVFSSPAPIPDNATASVIRTRLTTDASFFSDGTPPSHLGVVSNGEVQDQTIPINTLPVTLAGFNAVRLDAGRIALRWSVATEAGTLGYSVLQATGSATELAAGGEFIAASGVDTVLPQYYETTLLTVSDAPLYLEELSSAKNERFGPFDVGAVVGAELQFEAQPWAEVAVEVAQQTQRSSEQNLAAQRAANIGAAEAMVDRSGLQRVAIADLAQLGLRVIGAPETSLRIRRGDDDVGFFITGDGTLSAVNAIEFYAEAIADSRYTRTQPYLISLGLGNGFKWTRTAAAPLNALVASQMRRVYRLDEDRYYNFSAPSSDPWYFDTVRRNGATGERSWALQAPGLRAGPASLSIEVWGGIDFPEGGDDHRYRVSLNGQVLGERSFDGVRSDVANWALPAGLAVAGSNDVRVELLATGQSLDILRVESLSLSAVGVIDAAEAALGFVPESIISKPDGISLLSFEDVEPAPACGLGCEQLRVSGLPDADIVAVRVRGSSVEELTDLQVEAEGELWTASLRLPGLLGRADNQGGDIDRVLIASRSQMARPTLRVAALPVHPLDGNVAELLAIGPARLLTDIEPLLQARRAEGLSARSIDVETIYAHYSNGVVDPQAIRAFLASAVDRMGTRFVLLVGGDTYDYFDRLGLGSVSDVPTVYGRTHAVLNHAPLDHLYADPDDDGRLDLAVGRLPVRTANEVRLMVEKILTPSTSAEHTVVFAAERANLAEGADYAADIEDLIASLDPQWQVGAQRVFLDHYPAGRSGVVTAREELRAAINAGRQLVTYYGHGSPTIWSREQLLQSSQLSTLLGNAAGTAPVVAEFGCWGGYFVAPQFNTMSHSWLNAGHHGAVAMFASSGLTERASDREMAAELLSRLTVPGVRLGDALLRSKQRLIDQAPEYADVIRGLTLFGDPSMRMPE